MGWVGAGGGGRRGTGSAMTSLCWTQSGTSQGPGKSRQQHSGVPTMQSLGTHKLKPKSSEDWSSVQLRDSGALQSRGRAK